MFLFIDTETSGLPRFRRAPIWLLFNWPRTVQLGWILTDNEGNEIKSTCKTIRPGRKQYSSVSVAIHGISHEEARKTGSVRREVLEEFTEDLQKAQEVVAHNIEFDYRVLRAEFFRSWKPDSFKKKKLRCTMTESTEFCALPRGEGFKWPSLTELHQKLFNAKFDQQHNALVDARACMRCFWELRRLGVVT